ncbi:hypothetical protein RDWZM_008763 [Blomia tropicalis]|uniref:Gem-associated protein 2 n=1 Tax=Blomia tropicalis TaxID=40697 RepID=A0A9Q0M1W6_BLOTA|nr:hypothetical protein RDWZM_008763 [Blomia tropicalis]
MYHITDFEAAFESDKEDDPLLDHPQQQCLPVVDGDDGDFVQSLSTVDGRRYLRQVRMEATKYRMIRTNEYDLNNQSSECSTTVQSTLTGRHPIWNSRSLINDLMSNFKYTRKLISIRRIQASETRTDFNSHFDISNIALGESILISLHLCPNKQPNQCGPNNAYANGHQPQIAFLCELDQIEVIRVLRFFRIWLRRDGYRPQLGLWLYGLLSLLDPIQTGDVFHELRILFVACNHARMRTLLEVATLDVERDKCDSSILKPSSCISLTSSSSLANGNHVGSSKCVPCERIRFHYKQHSTLCLIMLIIGHFFAQRDLLEPFEQCVDQYQNISTLNMP